MQESFRKYLLKDFQDLSHYIQQKPAYIFHNVKNSDSSIYKCNEASFFLSFFFFFFLFLFLFSSGFSVLCKLERVGCKML